MVLNGAPIRFRTKTRLELTSHARFLFGKQIMSPDEADSPARRIYFAIQCAYIGDGNERTLGMHNSSVFVEEFKNSTTSLLARDILDKALTLTRSNNFYQALKLIRRVIRHEDAVLDRVDLKFSECAE